VTDLPDYRELIEPFVQAMVDELEANHYKGAPLPFRELDKGPAVGELFYHALKVAWISQNRPDDGVAARELTADVANCALICWLVLGSPTTRAEKPTILVGADDLGASVKDLTAVLVEHFGWDEKQLMAGVSV
jgi:hypothetical protein